MNQYELNAVWNPSDPFVKNGNRISCRITGGDAVTVVGNRILTKSNLKKIGKGKEARLVEVRPTHRLIGVYGGLIGKHEYILTDLNTNEPKLITQ